MLRSFAVVEQAIEAVLTGALDTLRAQMTELAIHMTAQGVEVTYLNFVASTTASPTPSPPTSPTRRCG